MNTTDSGAKNKVITNLVDNVFRTPNGKAFIGFLTAGDPDAERR